MEYSRFLVEVSKGEYFELVLDNKEGTGYVWTVAELVGDLLLLGQEEKKGTNQGVGSESKTVYQFVPAGRGRAKVVFKRVRPWQPKDVEARVEYIIHIGASPKSEMEKRMVR